MPDIKRCADSDCDRPVGSYGMWCCISCIPAYKGSGHATDCLMRTLRAAEMEDMSACRPGKHLVVHDFHEGTPIGSPCKCGLVHKKQQGTTTAWTLLWEGTPPGQKRAAGGIE